ncbi:division/cell wall cluster transcriptional repressor MraZ [Flammeovirgaceae bacterium SG7u.111]|nr:division/cell wall cluster transcriptional repressor MraZ [Flammeovirgaceae bacterium SG7u.132]WPO33802.1 division/cell wall cluster transcriptional repressor MraZ [Flammeovirgaceae bacterium SG7u.111]
MNSFSSEYECKLDDKGRLTLPARIKSTLPENETMKIVLKRGFETCLTIYPHDEWEKIYEKVVSLNEFVKEDRLFQRMYLRGNTELDLDKSGRVGIPSSMRKYAQLEKEVLLVGLGNRIEIWNPDVYDEYLFSQQEKFSVLAEKYLGSDEVSEPKQQSADEEDDLKEAS